jgi:cell division protein FtsZ
MKGARGVLINITGGTDMTLFEVDEAANRIREEVDPDANIIFGSTFDEKLAGKMRISVVATGIDAELEAAQARPALGARGPGGGIDAGLRDTGSGYTQPILTQNAANPPIARGAAGPEPARSDSREMRAQAAPESGVPVAEAAENAAVRSGAFIAPRPVDAGPARPVPVVGTAAAQPAAASAMEPTPRPKGRVPSLIERVTGVGRARPPAPVAPPRQAPSVAQPAAARPAQPRLAPLDPEQRPAASKEDDLLDIPAFLRRQAN